MNQKRNQTKVVNVFTVFMVMLILYFIVGLFTVINQQFQIPLQTAMLPHDGNITNALVILPSWGSIAVCNGIWNC